jgi:flagellar basal-body rod protein FlgG
MFRGFYTLTSDMLTQQRRLNVISNNMANAATPGFKKDSLMTTTFAEALAYRTGSIDKSDQTPLSTIAMMRVADEKITSYEQGGFDTTGRPLDVAIAGEGFFVIQTPGGENVYTRNGSFTLDEEGYLFLQHIGRVAGADGNPIMLATDKIEFKWDGTIVHADSQTPMGKLAVVGFTDYYPLEKTGEGMFLNEDPANVYEMDMPDVRWRMLERSNVNAMDEMVAMITSQRAIQSASQIIKMYDMIMSKAANEIGRL